MSKYHKIRWTKSDEQELARVVRNFNRKLDRLNKKDPSKILNTLPEGMKVNKNALPEKVSVRQLKNLIKTRQDLKRELNAMKRFSKKGAETIIKVPDTDYNLQVTKWQKNEMSRRIAVINKKRQERLEEIASVKIAGQEYTLGQLGMGRQAENELKPTTSFYRTMSQTDLKYKWRSIRLESQSVYFTEKDYRLRENYIKGLMENYSERDIKDVVNEIRNMDIKDFLHTFQSVDLNTFEFASGPPNQEMYKSYVERLKSEWTPNKKLKGE